MEFVGDFERLFASSIYPLRIPIFVGLVILTAVIVIAAIRGRWDRVAARHRPATIILIVALVALGFPAAWYLGSPLFLSTTLIEPPVDAALVDTTTETPSPSAGAASAASLAPTDGSPLSTSPRPSSTASVVSVRMGAFHGADDFHFGRGTATLTVLVSGSAVVRFEDFAVRNGPDLYVYLSPSASGYANGVVELGRLKADTGAFNYRVPAGTDVSRVKSVVVWCKQFSVQFAVAPLK